MFWTQTGRTRGEGLISTLVCSYRSTRHYFNTVLRMYKSCVGWRFSHVTVNMPQDLWSSSHLQISLRDINNRAKIIRILPGLLEAFMLLRISDLLKTLPFVRIYQVT